MKAKELIEKLKNKSELEDEIVLFFNNKWTDEVFVYKGVDGEVWISAEDLEESLKEVKSSRMNLKEGRKMGKNKKVVKEEIIRKATEDLRGLRVLLNRGLGLVTIDLYTKDLSMPERITLGKKELDGVIKALKKFRMEWG